MGNTRLSYFHNGSSIEVLEENNYYPFGLKHEGYNQLAGNPGYQYKYNGKELQETGMYDYGARFYMPDIGRWGVVDPLAEHSHDKTPYHYCSGDPINRLDPNGMCDDPNCSHGGLRRAWDSVGRFFGGWGHAEKKEQKAEITEFGPLEKIPLEEERSKVDVTLNLVFGLLLGGGSADPYTAIGNSGVGPYAEERENIGMAIMPFINPEAGAENLGKKIIEKTAEKTIEKVVKTTVKTAAGTEITGFVGHGVNRAIQRSVKPASMLDAIKNPLKTGDVVVDDLGRQSQRFIGKQAEVVVNPQNGKIISVNPTSTKKAAKLIRQQNGN